MTSAEYHSLPQLSCSGMKKILKNAREFHLWQQGKMEEDSYEMDVGTVYHAAMLEPDKVNDMIEVREPLSDGLKKFVPYFKANKYVDYGEDVHRNLKLFKFAKLHVAKDSVLLMPSEIQALSSYCNSEKIFLTQEDVDMINRMVVKTKQLPVIESYLESGEKEVTLFGELDGVPLKCRLDLMKKHSANRVSVLDLKTTFRDCTSESFAKDSANNDWYLQQAVYQEIVSQNFEGVHFDSSRSNASDFTFLVTSKEAWSGAGLFQHIPLDVETGEQAMRIAVAKYKKCKSTDQWPENRYDYNNNSFETIGRPKLPTYVFYKWIDV